MKLDASDIAELQPVIHTIVAETLAQIDSDRQRLGYPEAEAAQMLGIPKHKLRDARLRGEVYGRLIGRTMVYERGELLRFLRS